MADVAGNFHCVNGHQEHTRVRLEWGVDSRGRIVVGAAQGASRPLWTADLWKHISLGFSEKRGEIGRNMAGNRQLLSL